MEALRRDAAALELEQEPQARAQQVVQVLDGQSGERVRVKRGRAAAAQAGDELLLKQALPRLVEHAKLTRRADEVRELVEQPRARAVEGADPGPVEDLGTALRPGRSALPGGSLAQ